MAVNYGIRVVWGVPEKIMPVIGLPEGKARFRFRNTAPGKVFVKCKDGIRHFVLQDFKTHWGLIPQGENRKAK